MNTTFKDLLNLIFRYFRHLVLFTVVVILIVAAYATMATKVYESKAKILIRLGTEQSASNQFIGNMSNVYITRREQELKNELEILTSDWVMTQVAREVVKTENYKVLLNKKPWLYIDTAIRKVKELVGLNAETEIDVEHVKAYLNANLTVSALFESDTLEISLEFPDPEGAQAILNMVIDQFIKHHIRAYTNIKELNFLSEELEDSRHKYETALDDLARFTKKYGVFNDDVQVGLVMEQKRNLEEVLAQVRGDYAYHLRKLTQYQDILGPMKPYETFSTSMVLNRARDNLKNMLAEVQLEREKLLARYTPGSRFVNDINREIQKLESLLSKEPVRIEDQKERRKNPIYESILAAALNLDSDIRGEKAKIESLEEELASINQQLDKFGTHNKEFQLLTKKVDFAKKTYEKVFDGYLNTKLGNLISQQEITNISLIGAPSFNQNPSSPNKKKLALVTLAVLVAGNIFLLFFFSVIDNSVTNPSEIPRWLGTPVVGDVPFVKNAGNQERTLLDLHRKQMRPFQSLYTNLALKEGERDKVILVAKSRHGEGGTTISYNLAVFMASYQGKKVALVDYTGDKKMFKKQISKERVDENYERRNLHDVDVYTFIPESDQEEKMVKDKYYLLKSIKDQYDFVIVNTPPVSDSPDLVFLQRYVNKVILVIESEKTRTPIVKYNVALLKEYAFDNIAALLNKRRFYIPNVLYRFL